MSTPSQALAEAMAQAPKRSKFGNKPVVIDSIRFASGREGRRYALLRVLQQAGEISDLALQPRFPLKINGKLITTYVADFQYRDRNGTLVVEDSKGHRTRDYILKAKLFEALHGFPVREV